MRKLVPEKKQRPKESYLPVIKSTLDIHSSNVLPKSEKLRFVHPKAIEIPNVVVKRKKVILENMSSAIRKAPIPVFAIILIFMVGAIGVSIMYKQIVEPYIDKNVQLQAQIQRGELPPNTKIPGLFDFVQIPIPGIG